MSKSITIPSSIGSRITVTVNGVSYTYATGSTVTVPDEVAEAIGNALAGRPGGSRATAADELLAGTTKDIDTLAAGMDALADAIDGLDDRVTALEDPEET